MNTTKLYTFWMSRSRHSTPMANESTPALGLFDIEGLPSALKARDIAVKKAIVEVSIFAPVSPGRTILGFTGDIAEVTVALEEVGESVGPRQVHQLLLPAIAESAYSALMGAKRDPAPYTALGVLEFTGIVPAVDSADRLVKRCGLEISRLHPATGYGGRAFLTVYGELGNVEDGLEHIAEAWGADLLDRELIPNPLPETSTPVFIRPWSLDPAD